MLRDRYTVMSCHVVNYHIETTSSCQSFLKPFHIMFVINFVDVPHAKIFDAQKLIYQGTVQTERF